MSLNEIDQFQELSLEECETVSGGPILATWAIFTGMSVLGFAATAANDPKDNRRGSGNEANRTPTWNRSDRRLKQNIKVEGELSHLGISAYSWEYKDAPGERFVGVMAQDLLQRDDLRSAVVTFTEGPFKGFYGVDYGRLGLLCLPVEAWDGNVSSLEVGLTLA